MRPDTEIEPSFSKIKRPNPSRQDNEDEAIQKIYKEVRRLKKSMNKIRTNGKEKNLEENQLLVSDKE